MSVRDLRSHSQGRCRAAHPSQVTFGGMAIFDPQNATHSPAVRRVYAQSSMLVALINFLAAIAFIVGSVLFFNTATTTTGTWLFLIGSIFFAVSPTVTLLREMRLDAISKEEKRTAAH